MRVGRLLSLAGLAVLTACAPPGPPAADQDGGGHDDDGAPSASAGAIMGESLAARLEILEGKMVALARAMPEEGYAWRPMEGVRSVGEVYAHAAGDNWFVLAVLGMDVPPETGVTTEDGTVAAYEDRVVAKADIVAGMEASFTALRAALDAGRPEMDREILLRQTSITVGDLWIRAIVHLHEHLGQSIAYARSNGVAPPWSR